jgi:hypothetical protein
MWWQIPSNTNDYLMQGLTPLVTSCRAMQKANTYLCENDKNGFAP